MNYLVMTKMIKYNTGVQPVAIIGNSYTLITIYAKPETSAGLGLVQVEQADKKWKSYKIIVC